MRHRDRRDHPRRDRPSAPPGRLRSGLAAVLAFLRPRVRTRHRAAARPPVSRRSGLRRLLGLGGTAVLSVVLGLGYLGWVNPFGSRPSVNLLLLGADQGIRGPARSDTLVVAQIVFAPRFQIKTVAIPRDTRVTIPGRGPHKINAAMAFGGVELARRTIEYNFDLPIHRTVQLTSASTARLVDAVGGVTVEVPQRMRYQDRTQDLTIDLPPGKQRLNGQQAVHFLRWRSDGQGDLGRMARQRAFLRSVAREALTPVRLPRWPRVLAVLRNEVATNLSLHETVFLAMRCGVFGERAIETRRVRFRLQAPYVRLRPDALREAISEEVVARQPATPAP